jgi:hypothetical protein
MSRVTLTLTARQARLVEVAVQQEIRKGSSTFLSGRDVLDLGRVAEQIRSGLDSEHQALMARLTAAAEDYCDACDYTSYCQLTTEDISYLAHEAQISPAEYTSLMGVR